MKSTEFINEGNDGPVIPEKEWLKIVKSIHRDCKPFLQQAKGGTLYRGLGNADDDFLKKKVRLTDRVPKDMPQEIHNKLNQYFLMKHGGKFRNALFVSGDMSVAIEYGNLYRIFPIGQFEFLWSPKVFDLYQDWEEYEPKKWDVENRDIKLKEALKFFHDEILKDGYTTDNLAAAIQSKNEIMLRGRNYYAVNEDLFDDIPAKWAEML